MRKQLFSIKTGIGILSLFLCVAGFSSYGQNLSHKNDHSIYTSGEYISEKVDISSSKEMNVIKNGTATITEMIDAYMFPSSIDVTGTQVVIQTFGMSIESFYWTVDGGLVTFPGKGTSIASNGTIAGDFTNDNFPGGGTAETAGTWDIASQTWTFLGMNPEYPNTSDGEYNSAWGQSNDGSTIVGMQWDAAWSVTAFKWSEANGYTMIGDGLNYDSRASGISGNGEVIYGWVASDMGYWRPIIWHDNTYTLVAGEDEAGEVNCASNEGTYVAGNAEENAFLWSEEGGLVTFGGYDDYPTIVMEDGSVFGFNTVFPPTNRVAFYRDTEGNMMSFNDYAESRGMENAQDWSFYSINDATPDGNKFIGAGINPDGQDVSFLIEFEGAVQTYMLDIVASPVEGGEVSGNGEFEAGMSVDIEAIANENYAFIDWTNEAGDIVSTEAVTSIIMEENDMTLTANFESTVVVSEAIENVFSFYPNPATSKITIDVNEPTTLRIMNLSGKVLVEKSIDTNADIDIENLSNGVYIINVNNAKGSTCHKLVKK